MKNEMIKNEIIEYIKRNRVSSVEVADALGKTGAVPRVLPINRGHFRVGNVFWGYAYGGSNWEVHEQIQNVEEGDIVFIETFDCGERAIFGDLVAKYLFLYRQVNAIVVTGLLRDVHRLIKENWPIWCEGYTPIGCVNKKPEKSLDNDVIAERMEKYHGAIAVCDDTGVTIIPKNLHTREMLEKLKFIEEQEDIWYECIDRKKMSTFETVCLKKYLNKMEDTQS